ncbi:MAG: zinc dependent phospholipase C family protein [Promethearchaeota archaeon]
MNRKSYKVILLISALTCSLFLVAPIIPRTQAWGLSTHMWMVNQAIAEMPTGDWKTAFEFFSSYIKSGSTTPDQAWQDWDNHLYYPDQPSLHTAHLAVEEWYGYVLNNFTIGEWKKGMFAAGVLAHYFSDPNIPIHTDETWSGHGTLEDDINQHLGTFSFTIAAPQQVADPKQYLIENAIYAHQYYDDCVTLYPNSNMPSPSPLDSNSTFHDMIETQLERAVTGFRNLWYSAIQGLEAPIIPSGAVSYNVLIDAGHNNYYTMATTNELTAFKAQLNMWTINVIVNEDELTADDLYGVDLLIITPPIGVTYTAEETDVIADWVVNQTGALLVAAYSEHFRDPAYYPTPAEQFQRQTLDWLLANCSSHIQLNDDSVYEGDPGAYAPWYVDITSLLSGSLTFGITDDVAGFRMYSPCSLWFTDIENITEIVMGDPSCYQSINVVSPPPVVVYDNTNNQVGGDSIPLIATETVNGSRIMVSGTTFFSDYDYGALLYVDNDVFIEQALEWLLNGSLVELDFYGPEISQITVTPSIPVGGQPLTISALVTDVAGVDNVTLYYQVSGGAWQSLAMVDQGEGIYSTTIPASDVIELSNIAYYFKAYDELGYWKMTMPVTLMVTSSQLIQLILMAAIVIVIVVILAIVLYLILRRRKGKAI